MLGVRAYSREYIQSCRSKVQSDIHAYLQFADPENRAGLYTADETENSFEQVFFNNMVLVLEICFVHQLRTVEGKDGNPLNEVRLLAGSILTNDSKVGVDSTMKIKTEKTVLKLKPGDPIALNEKQFLALSEAFFAEIECRFAAD